MKEPYYVFAYCDDTQQMFIHKVWARSPEHAQQTVARARPYAVIADDVPTAQEFDAWMGNLAKLTKRESDLEMLEFIYSERS